jgi:hypothetical protein
MRCEGEAAADTTTAEAAIAEAGTTDGMIVRTLAETAREVCATLGEKTDAIEATRAASRTLKTAAAAAAGTAAAAIAATVATAAAIAGAAIVIAATVATAVVIARVACASTGKRGAATAVSLVDSPTKANNAPTRRFTANHAFAMFFTVDRFDDDYDEPRIKIYDDVYICCC